ncbi:unnamed protein product, partial [Rotaria sordida]
ICLIISLYYVYRSLFNSIKNQPLIINKETESFISFDLNKETKSLISFDLNKYFEEISENLPPFYIRLPNFSDNEAKNWFYSSTYYKINSKKCPNNSCEQNGILFNDIKEHLSVKIAFIKNGLYLNDDCGYNYGDTDIRRTFQYDNETTVIYDKAILYTVPD